MSIWFKPIGFGVYLVSTNWTALFIGLIWLVQMGLDIGNQWTVCPIDISRPKEELQIGNSDELSNLPESESETETRDEKISEATASTPPPPLSRSSVHDQSIRMADFGFGKEESH
ncbi:uncharacterized protein LOC125577051 [Brassica napus]|uniref:uncharacterized protein LOC125577051 n=1 Tax=Brassica napus TaxID=3708 RepID=UPI0020785C4E|nr:uncharacterized protein LOC125577051 [Brassica napus]